MGVYRRNGCWCIDYYVGPKRLREKIGNSKNMAEEALKMRLAKVTLGTHPAPADATATFAELHRRYSEWARDHHKEVELEEYMLKRLDRWFGATRLDRITPWHIEQMKTAMRKDGLSGPRVNRYLARLSKMFSLAIKWGLVERNPVKGVEKYRENPGRLRYLTHEEVARLLLACRPDLRDAVTVAVCTGLRKSEQFGLTWSDLDLEHRLIFIRDSKSGKARQVPMSDRVLATFARMKEERTDEVVFPSAQSMMRTAWEKTRPRAGLTGVSHVRWHDLRHTFASHMIMAGVGIPKLQQLLGHATIQMTMRYAHLAPEVMADTVTRIDSLVTGQLAAQSVTNRSLDVFPLVASGQKSK
ncbi:MAG: site-specific integrase [Deltaproteobacteria bacterium]|nr:site-specific integrase [Deltaproteobacteria bacterium]